jgi:hypothetical protein
MSCFSDYIDSIAVVDDLDIYEQSTIPALNEYLIQDYAEDQIELIEKLVDIGSHEDYYGKIDQVTLERISQLPFMQKTKEQNLLLDEVLNIREGFSFFQPESNKLLKEMISFLSKLPLE